MSTCGTCRWWLRGDLRDDTIAAGLRGCELTRTDYALHDDGAVHALSLATAESGEGGAGLLLTRADFGCTQWAEGTGRIERDPIWQAIVDRVCTDIDCVVCDGADCVEGAHVTDRAFAIWYWWHYGSDIGGEPIPGIQEAMHEYGFYADGWGET